MGKDEGGEEGVKKGKKTFTKVKITLPEKKEVYKGLRDELEEVNVLASHYADKAISDAQC
ncbi:hypothetical protein MetMK1DRAFT_00000170 [Metallosphaera yellowstonensis MK1]|uniref:Uncharacterized protein n=1 Tax=Metallosphaera yellowstonensis MK1 TaxID=671065 RepID=H2C0E6_9CREN|nr:hypothetical protein [Metallosphaera yellowstonensis]EHP71323.1 hypothetical protein MetMK1DRAFT_00000170 [Metallosphaera yellowstonensis MK1]